MEFRFFRYLDHTVVHNRVREPEFESTASERYHGRTPKEPKCYAGDHYQTERGDNQAPKGTRKMMLKSDIRHIIEHGKPEDMYKLEELFNDVVEDLRESDEDEYCEIVYKVHKIAYGGHLGEDLAKKWVDSMENKDGTHGAHWSWDEVDKIRKQYAPETDEGDFYAAISMMYSDYYNSRFDTATYAQLAKDWLDDKDVGGCKTLKYYMRIVK